MWKDHIRLKASTFYSSKLRNFIGRQKFCLLSLIVKHKYLTIVNCEFKDV